MSPLQPAEPRTPPHLELVARRKRPILRPRAGPSRRAGPRWMAEWIPTGALPADGPPPVVRRRRLAPSRLAAPLALAAPPALAEPQEAAEWMQVAAAAHAATAIPICPQSRRSRLPARLCQQPKTFPQEASQVKPASTHRPSKKCSPRALRDRRSSSRRAVRTMRL